MVAEIIKGDITKAEIQCLCYILNDWLRNGKPQTRLTHYMIHIGTGLAELTSQRATSRLNKLGLLCRERDGGSAYKYWFDKQLLGFGNGTTQNDIKDILLVSNLNIILNDNNISGRSDFSKFTSYWCGQYKKRTGRKKYGSALFFSVTCSSGKRRDYEMDCQTSPVMVWKIW